MPLEVLARMWALERQMFRIICVAVRSKAVHIMSGLDAVDTLSSLSTDYLVFRFKHARGNQRDIATVAYDAIGIGENRELL